MGDVCTMDAESATFGWTRAVTAGMRGRRYGRIVNVSSIAAIGTALVIYRLIQ